VKQAPRSARLRHRLSLLGCAVLALGGVSALAEDRDAAAPPPMLWRIALDPPSHLLGTIHVSDPRVLRLPAPVEAALGRADVVYTEVELDPETTTELRELTRVPEGKRLADVLSPALHARLVAALSARGLNPADFESQAPWIAAYALILVRDPDPAAALNPPLDLYIRQRAVLSGKQVAGLEVPADQVAAMEAVARDGGVSMLESTLDELERDGPSGASQMDRMIDAYLLGDDAGIFARSLGSLDRKSREALIDRRNEVMADRIEESLRDAPEESHLFAVGVLHMPGKRGVLELLRKRGFRIERVPASP
jgi:uncharacterized protein YbaP (TraB family)